MRSENLQASHESFKTRFWYLGKEDMLISVELLLYSAHCYWMYASRITYESQNTHQIRCAMPRS